MEAQERGRSTWLLTGGNRGIGLAFAHELARRGEHVLATARDPEKASELEVIDRLTPKGSTTGGQNSRGKTTSDNRQLTY